MDPSGRASSSTRPSGRTLARAGVALVVVALLVPAGVAALTAAPADFQRGTVTDPADGPTVVGVQGFHFQGRGAEKKPARLVSITGEGRFDWQQRGDQVGGDWFYDVDPLADGNLLVVSTAAEETLVYEFDPESREAVWLERLDTRDTHDVDLLPNGNLVVADMRNNADGVANDRLFVYNRTTDAVTWEWRFRDHYPNGTDGGFSDDWTHLNDVDVIDEHRLLASPRNFDQVVVVNRTSGEIEMRLGSDDDHDVLFEQHNPDWLVSETGRPTILVADSENDRVVEYERRCERGDPMTAPMDDCSWALTWELGTEGGLNWPRDADRLPNGNTLVTDSLNHRVIEVTPDGEIVWEYYVTWGPYDAERVDAVDRGDWTGGSARGPTTADMDATGGYALSGSADASPVPSDVAGGPAALLADAGQGELAATWRHVVPWVKPVWMTDWELVSTATALLVVLGWGAVEVARGRGRLRARIARLLE
jgi:hypothetical protein